MGRKPKLSKKDRQEAVDLVLRGETLGNVAELFSVSRTTIRNAVMTSKTSAPKAFYHNIVDGRCQWCGAKTDSIACLDCEIANSLF